MHLLELVTFIVYFAMLLGVVFFFYKKQQSDTEFVLGNRSLNFYLTALSAHASEMSSWLFMAYPALIFTTGIFNVWAAIGLVVFMFLNWQLIAPRIRVVTEKDNNLTLNAYFESRFKDHSGALRTLCAILSLFFFLVYIASGLVSLGYLAESLFGLNYFIGISIGLLIIVFYVYIGGYVTVAWIDLFQGFFLLGVILLVPLGLLWKIGGFAPIFNQLHLQQLSSSIFPDLSLKTIVEIIFIACGWGLGYWGQPHIITKFMGIKNPKEMYKAKYLGVSWQILTLGAATLIGMIGIVLFPQGIANPELVTLELVKSTLVPFFAGMVLCAILAATTNVMAAQILVVASSLAEDFYQRLFRKNATHKELLTVSRAGVIIIALFSFTIAFFQPATIYKLVLYAWSGLGASFGPLLLISLYSKKVNRTGAFSGVIVGGLISAIWPTFDAKVLLSIEVPPLIPAFICSTIAIFAGSAFSSSKSA